MSSSIWIGAYTADAKGNGAGISLAARDADGAITGVALAAPADSPSFLATHPTLPVVYAVHEFAQTIGAYRVSAGDEGGEGVAGDTLEPLGEAWEAGAAVCHVAVSPDGGYAVATCWGDGRVLVYELDGSGAIVGRTQAPASVDPHADEAEEPRQSRAHSSLLLSDGRLLTTDLGHDTVRVWRVGRGPDGVGLTPAGETVLPFGSGPRHMALHPSGHVYIVTEYSIEVFVLDPRTLGVASRASALAAGAHDGDAGAHVSFDGDRHVHTTVRGANAVGVLEVTDAGARLVPVADVPCGGVWPRHHLRLGDRLYVANQLSDDIAVFGLRDGIPTLEQTVPTGSPTCLVPVA